MDKQNDDKKRPFDEDDPFDMPIDQINLRGYGSEKKKPSKFREKLPSILFVCGLFIIVVGIAAGILWINFTALKTEVSGLRAKINSMDVVSIKSQIKSQEEKLDVAKKENEKLKNELAQLKKDIDAIKAKKEKADLTSQKFQSGKKKSAGKDIRNKPRNLR